MYTILAYIIYLSFSLLIVIWVGKLLHKNGKDYLFAECPDKNLSEAANNMLYVGYCLLNTGFAFHQLNTELQIQNSSQLLEFITASEGFILTFLSVMHFINMILAPKIITFFFKHQQKHSINH